MKIICIDNFNRDSISDILICTNINEYIGLKVVNFLNEAFGGDTSVNYYRLVKDDHKLYEFKP